MKEHHGLITRFFLRHVSFLMRLYGSKETEAIWHYATMFVAIVLATHAVFFLALVAAFLPGNMNLSALSRKVMGVAIAVVMVAAVVWVDTRFARFKSNLAEAGEYGRPSDGLKLFMTFFFALLSGIGYGLLVWWRNGH